MVSYRGTGLLGLQGEHSNKCLLFLMGASGLLSPVVCKLEHKSESPGRLVKRQTAHPAMTRKTIALWGAVVARSLVVTKAL